MKAIDALFCPLDNGDTRRFIGSTYMAAARKEFDDDLDGSGNGDQQFVENIKRPDRMVLASSFFGFHYGKYGYDDARWSGWIGRTITREEYDIHGDALRPYAFVDGHAVHYSLEPDEGFGYASDIIDWGNR